MKTSSIYLRGLQRCCVESVQQLETADTLGARTRCSKCNTPMVYMEPKGLDVGWHRVPSGRMFDDARAFNLKMGWPAPQRPEVPEGALRAKWKAALQEEVDELAEAVDEGDLGHVAHEAIDVIYTALSLLAVHGIRPEAAWDAVHAANMEKVPDPRGPAYKAVKPPGWRPADVDSIVADMLR